MIRKGVSLALFILMSSVVAAQPHAPVVTMSVMLPDGRMEELTAPEGGVVTVSLKDGTEYSFRPTIQDSAPWNRIVVTIFRAATTSTATEVLAAIELKRGGPAVDSKTAPSFKVAVPNVAPPATPTNSTS